MKPSVTLRSFLLFCVFLLSACADSLDTKTFIETLEDEQYAKTVQALSPGAEVRVVDTTNTVYYFFLKNSTPPVTLGLDLNNNGINDIVVLSAGIKRLSPWAFIVPVDIDADQTADYYLLARDVDGRMSMRLLAQNNDGAKQIRFLLDGIQQIQGIDADGDGLGDDSRLNGITVTP